MVDYPSVAQARLPQSYIDVKAALLACAKQFTPERYVRATVAMHECADEDECSSWPRNMDTAATYCRIADDDELRRLIRRVEKARSKWLERTARG